MALYMGPVPLPQAHADDGGAEEAGVPSLAITTKAEHRSFDFPIGESIGSLYLIRPGMGKSNSQKSVGFARGHRDFDVPPGWLVQLQIGGNVFKHPDLLKGALNANLDSVEVSFLSMEKSEEGFTDRVLARVAEMKKVRVVYAERSDATDKGVSELAKLPNLRFLSCFCTRVNGSFLKQFARVQSLEQLSIRNCPLDHRNLKYLSELKNLRSLNLAEVGLTDDDIRTVSRCKTLMNLRVSNNPLTDKSIEPLSSLPNLKALNVGDTNITTAGLTKLPKLQFKLLTVPYTVSTADKAKLKHMFPHSKVRIMKPRTVSREELDIFAPAH